MSRTYDTPIGKVPSVTTILDVAFSNSYLGPWYGKLEREAMCELWWKEYNGLTHFESKEHLAKHVNDLLGKYEGQKKFEEATALGSLVDNMISAYYDIWVAPGSVLMCDNPMTFNPTEDYILFLSDLYPEKPLKILSSFFRAIKDSNIKIKKTQQTVYHPDGFSGTLDYEVEFDDAEGIGDLKVTSDIRLKNWLQLEAYRRAKSWMSKKEPVFRMIIWMDSNNPGKCEIRIRPLEVNTEIRIWEDGRKKNKSWQRDINHFPCDHVKDYQAFLAAKTLFERSQNK